MSQPGRIVRDLWGDEWRVMERRDTDYGFAILMGRSYPPLNVQGGSGPTTMILTPAVANHLRIHARRPYALPLPVGRDAIRRARIKLGIDKQAWDDSRFEWWVDRLDDLATLPVPDFVARHRDEAWTRTGGLSEALVWQMRIALLGRHRRPIGWWKAPEVRALLTSTLSQDIVGKRLQIRPVMVGALRRKLRREERRSTKVRTRSKRPATRRS